MATYYHGNPEIQGGDGLQTLILMNPGYVGFSDAQSSGNLVFLNSFAAGNSLASASNLPHSPQQFVGVPVSHTAASQDPPPPSVNAHQDLSQLHGFLPRQQYNLWNSVDPSAVARDPPRATQQGLSLSLSPQQPAGYGSSYSAAERDAASIPQAGTNNNNSMRISGGSSSPASGITNGVSGMQSVLLSSKYLKAAQQLLDEVVNVGNGMKTESPAKRSHGLPKTVGESSASVAAGDILMIGGDAAERSSTELTTAERQEIQMKKAKLVGMLDEVEQRYRQYHHQMQMVISTFEQMAGVGSAKTYTALALETISKQFRCLKDAISAQIRGANKCLGQDESSGARIEGSRLKFVDYQLRQQRALQQLGMMQHSAWRPQRGLPERSVSVLRAWLFEHFLHPYPKDSDKHLLAKQTGLTRSQVSNWFINARVRLWKPMVEEMYLEELKEQEQNHHAEDKSTKSEDSGSKLTAADKSSMIPDNPSSNNFVSNKDNSLPQPPLISMSTAVSSANVSHSGGGYATAAMDGIIFTTTTQASPNKQRSTESLLLSPNGVVSSMNIDVKPGDAAAAAIGDLHMKFGGGERQSRDEYSLMSTNYIGGFGSYPMGEIGRFEADPFPPPPPPRFPGNGSVSLTLGLPHCENGLSLSVPHHQNFIPNHGMQLGRRVDMGAPTAEYGLSAAPRPSHSAATTYEDLNLQNRKPFAAQLLPDFVA